MKMVVKEHKIMKRPFFMGCLPFPQPAQMKDTLDFLSSRSLLRSRPFADAIRSDQVRGEHVHAMAHQIT